MKWAEKNSTYDVTHKKLEIQNLFPLQMRRLAESFEALNSSPAESSAEIFPHKNTCKLLDFSLNLPDTKVLTL